MRALKILILSVLINIFYFPLKIKNMYAKEYQKNVYSQELEKCTDGTGYYRNGYCKTGNDDVGTHVVCAEVTEDFLNYTKSQGNDLSTPTSYFPGLKPGDRWCLCGYRFEQARKAGFAPKVYLEGTHSKALEFTSIEDLKKYSI